MTDTNKKVIVDKSDPGYWRVTLNNPPINAINDSMYLSPIINSNPQ